jgi:hypothetical protein
VSLCAPSPVSVSTLTAALPGSASLRIDNYVATSSASASLNGMGELVISGPPSRAAHLSLGGSGSLQASATQADVNLKGMGDIYVSGADAISGSLSGMGHVYYSPQGASCTVSGWGMGGCAYGQAPSPRLSCSDHSESDVDSANARGWVVEVYGNGQCQAHVPNAADALLEVTETATQTAGASGSGGRAAAAAAAMIERARGAAAGLWARIGA